MQVNKTLPDPFELAPAYGAQPALATVSLGGDTAYGQDEHRALGAVVLELRVKSLLSFGRSHLLILAVVIVGLAVSVALLASIGRLVDRGNWPWSVFPGGQGRAAPTKQSALARHPAITTSGPSVLDDADLTGASAAKLPGATFRYRDFTPEQARVWNALIPVSSAANPPAKPFVLKTENLTDYQRAVGCLAAAIYYEAGSESQQGQQAVAQVVLNRLRHPAFPKTVCGVVFEGAQLATGCQFSFTCDGSMARPPSGAAWARARKISVAALGGFVAGSVGQATHYHAVYVAPYWSPMLLKVKNIGAHIFYRWMGGAGMAGAFHGTYAGTEPYISKLALISDEFAADDEKVSISMPKAIAPVPMASVPGEAPTEGGLEPAAPLKLDRVVIAQVTSPDVDLMKALPAPQAVVTTERRITHLPTPHDW